MLVSYGLNKDVLALTNFEKLGHSLVSIGIDIFHASLVEPEGPLISRHHPLSASCWVFPRLKRQSTLVPALAQHAAGTQKCS